MKQVLQSLQADTVELAEVPAPRPGPGHVLIRTVASVISPGTERMLSDFAKAGLVGKARQQPERVRQVLEKARTDGLAATIDAVRARLDEPIPLGYANAGRILEIGPGVTSLSPGDFVASNGPHAELVSVPETLCSIIPDRVEPEEAATATLAAVALQGIRLAQPTLGERFIVTGLGFIGLLAVQLLAANGCLVLGVDPDPTRRARASDLGANTASPEVALVSADEFSRGRGVDGVVVTASTASSEPIHQAAQVCRKRGRVVLVGVTGLDLVRSDFYEKELTFSVSCSYGPGRYDSGYEERATDYPLGFVRWTAGRNLEAALDMMESGRLAVASLLTHRFRLEDAPSAYATLATDASALGVVLRYSEPTDISDSALSAPTISVRPVHSRPNISPDGTIRVGVIGAGNFATRVMLPAIKSAGAELVAIAARGGRSAASAAERFGFARSTSVPEHLLDDPTIDAILVFTRHDSHPHWVSAALEAGKHVFVEKPLAIDNDGLESVVRAWESSPRDKVVLVGFNRRFAPITRRMVNLIDQIPGPRAVDILINAGSVESEHWTQDPLIGGGRIIGEACHFIDLARYLTGSRITRVSSVPLGRDLRQSAAISLGHEDGSASTIGYFVNGSNRFPKERVTVMVGGRVIVNDNFRRMATSGWSRPRGTRQLGQDKGHTSEMAAFLHAIRTGGASPIQFEQLIEVTGATLQAASVL